MGGTKSTKAQVTERITKVNELLTMGLRPSEIMRYISEKTDWNVSSRQVENYMRAATEQIEASAKFHRDREIGRNLQRMQTLYQRNMSIQDFKAALSTVKAINEMLGLNAPTKTTVTGNISAVSWKDFISGETSGSDEDSRENSE